MIAPERTPYALAVEIGRTIGGETPLVSRFQAERGHVFRLDFAKGTAARVIKIAKDNADSIRREQRLLRELGALGFEVPPVELTQDDFPDSPVAFTVIPLIRGTSVAAIYTQDTQRGIALFERYGAFLGRLAALNPASVSAALEREPARALELATWDAHYAVFTNSGWRRDDFDRYHQEARDLLVSQTPDWFGVREGGHLITDGAGTYSVVDWGEAGYCWPYADLARCIHTMQTVHELHGGQWMECLLRGFKQFRPLGLDWDATVETWLLYLAVREALVLTRSGRTQAGVRLLKKSREMAHRRWMDLS